MGCAWKTIRGIRQRIGPVIPIPSPRAIILKKLPAWMALRGLLRLFIPTLSPEIDWDKAVLRLWERGEMGWLLEVRVHPTDPPIYHAITAMEAELWVAGEPTPEFIERLLKVEEPVME